MQVLENFKEVSRLMTETFLDQKRMEAKIGCKLATTTETQVVCNQMTNILKKLQSQRLFNGPCRASTAKPTKTELTSQMTANVF